VYASFVPWWASGVDSREAARVVVMLRLFLINVHGA
jgi:hypothetical protein